MEENYSLKEEFLRVWSLENLQEMTLEQYTNLNRENSFCYWLEQKTSNLGGIKGGSSYKFGIYKMSGLTPFKPKNHNKSDGEYAWFTKYGNTKEEAFDTIKNYIIQIAQYSNNNNLGSINEIDLGNAFKWKIAFMYGNYNVINIFKISALKFLANRYSYQKKNIQPFSEYYQYLLINKPKEEGFFEYTNRLWSEYESSLHSLSEKAQIQKSLFIEWLIDNDLDEVTADELEALSFELLKSKKEIQFIYDINSFKELENFILEALNTNEISKTIKHYREFFKNSEAMKYNIDLSFNYSLVKCNNQKEAISFINNGYWEKEGEKVHKNYVNRLDKESRIALIQNFNEISKILAIGIVKRKSYNGTNLQIDWQEKYISRDIETHLTSPHLDFFLVEPNTDDNLQLIKRIFYQPAKNIKYPLNQILYGPPGTGKTYKTKELAVNIILGEQERNREDIIRLYEDLKNRKQISFTTFHQSMSYEDFVEGIKPVMDEDDDESDEQLKYEIKKGIFKQICDNAKGISGNKKKDESVDFSKVNYYKMSIGGKHRKNIHDWCINNNTVAMGWGDAEDYSEYAKISNWNEFKDKFTQEFPHLVEGSSYHINAMFRFQKMKIGDIVVISLGNFVIDAIGIIDGDYTYNPDDKNSFYHHRKVKWLATNMNASPDFFIDKKISQQSIYQFKNFDVNIDKFEEYFKSEEKPIEKNNYVLIIDEINRGNISSIFGELITLLEEDKRNSADEEIEVILPYSKLPFKVPSNLYIIGTMNTADRSVESLDTALRRRFSFKEILPSSKELIKAHESLAVLNIDGVNVELGKILNAINSRITLLLDKDHQIGHSYFIKVKSLEDLIIVFRDKVIPLLEEYFYGDFGKIGLVLGKNFIKIEEERIVKFADFEHDDKESLMEKTIYEFTDFNNWDSQSFTSIYS